jgi:hypothetical protein
MPTTAGAIDVIIGVATIFTGLFFIAGGAGLGGGDLSPSYTISGILLIIIGTLAIVCSVFSFIRMIWPLALTGAIAALLGSIPWLFEYWRYVDNLSDLLGIDILYNFLVVPGIAAIILTVLSRKQFMK